MRSKIGEAGFNTTQTLTLKRCTTCQPSTRLKHQIQVSASTSTKPLFSRSDGHRVCLHSATFVDRLSRQPGEQPFVVENCQGKSNHNTPTFLRSWNRKCTCHGGMVDCSSTYQPFKGLHCSSCFHKKATTLKPKPTFLRCGGCCCGPGPRAAVRRASPGRDFGIRDVVDCFTKQRSRWPWDVGSSQ